MKIKELQSMSLTSLNTLGYINWDGEHRLIPLDYFHAIDDGEELIDIMGNKVIKGKDYIDLDTRGGCIAYGFPYHTPEEPA
jgi:hypothetical protein